MDKTFTNIIDNDIWKSDDSFVQRRLAGNCPFNIRKVTKNGKVTNYTNMSKISNFNIIILFFMFEKRRKNLF